MVPSVHLMELPSENLATMDRSPDRRAAARALVDEYGGTIRDLYSTFGRCDVVAVAEYPDRGAAATAAVRVRGEGNTTVATLPAFTDAEWDAEVVERLAARPDRP